jgi:hypothetical protein
MRKSRRVLPFLLVGTLADIPVDIAPVFVAAGER